MAIQHERFSELRGMLADMHRARTQPHYENPGIAIKLKMVRGLGFIAGQRYNPRIPRWPTEQSQEPPAILGYGVEKIAYRVPGTNEHARVLSVYHTESLARDALEIATKKRANYETYRNYFTSLVVPTVFAVVDNPWGSGGKPASLQRDLHPENARPLTSYAPGELHQKAAQDDTLRENIDLLVYGYRQMAEDGLCPDFAETDLLVADSKILIFDTGLVHPLTELERLRKIHPTYAAIEGLSELRDS